MARVSAYRDRLERVKQNAAEIADEAKHNIDTAIAHKAGPVSKSSAEGLYALAREVEKLAAALLKHEDLQ